MVANRAKILAILGPTCSGKSSLALSLARSLDAEIVNADSMQIFRHFDIGTAKPTLTERAEVPHHLIDIADPDTEFNVAIFQERADNAIRDVLSRNRVPLVVGGTGLYFRVLFHGLFSVKSDPGVRTALKERFSKNPVVLYEELKSRDPEYAAAISPNDATRVVRGLEVLSVSGKPMSAWLKAHGFREERYEAHKIGLRTDRGVLYRRIDERVKRMLGQGWVKETEALLAVGWDPGLKPFQSIGYREILLFLNGQLSHEEMVEDIKTSTRRYAKRQMTWFAKEEGIRWYEYPEEGNVIADHARRFLE
jgi:tRNA dimethylallyltransferase